MCQMALGTLDNDAENVSHSERIEKDLLEGFSVKDDIDIGEIPFECRVIEEFNYSDL